MELDSPLSTHPKDISHGSPVILGKNVSIGQSPAIHGTKGTSLFRILAEIITFWMNGLGAKSSEMNIKPSDHPLLDGLVVLQQGGIGDLNMDFIAQGFM